MILLVRTDATHPDFVALVQLLDADLAQRDGEDHAYYHQFNTIDKLKQVVVAYENNVAVGCGALKPFGADAMEVKRMYVSPAHRGKGIAAAILTALESWATELGATRCVLETGKKQLEAMALYRKSGYKVIPNYDQYAGLENSVCFEKVIA
ncbi:MAG: GNAT family N-acetyltransferase [Cyclobacteriaceae bacterium]|nr:GNAT family N-acetyltransferase [Cyclobacteriaceae bacterium]